MPLRRPSRSALANACITYASMDDISPSSSRERDEDEYDDKVAFLCLEGVFGWEDEFKDDDDEAASLSLNGGIDIKDEDDNEIESFKVMCIA